MHIAGPNQPPSVWALSTLRRSPNPSAPNALRCSNQIQPPSPHLMKHKPAMSDSNHVMPHTSVAHGLGCWGSLFALRSRYTVSRSRHFNLLQPHISSLLNHALLKISSGAEQLHGEKRGGQPAPQRDGSDCGALCGAAMGRGLRRSAGFQEKSLHCTALPRFRENARLRPSGSSPQAFSASI